MLVLFGLFLLAAPFAQVKLAEVWAFIPSYQSALLVIDLITAVLLFAQFAILGAQALLVLAGGYLFTALMAVPHALSFPRLFAPEGLIGAGPQTTAWLYMIWHAGFPLAVIGYALLRDSVSGCGVLPSPSPSPASSPWPAVCGATLLTTAGHALLPAIMRGDGYTPMLPIVTGAVWLLSLMALLVLWKQRAYSVLDVWLMVVVSAWLFEIALSAMLECGPLRPGLLCRSRVRPDGGDPGAARAADRDGRRLCPADAFLRSGTRCPRSAIARDTVGTHPRLAVDRTRPDGSALAHEVNQPLTAAGSYVRAGRRLVQAGDTAKADEALQKGVDQVTRAEPGHPAPARVREEGREPPHASRMCARSSRRRQRSRCSAPRDAACTWRWTLLPTRRPCSSTRCRSSRCCSI